MDSSKSWTGKNSLLDGGPKCPSAKIWLVLDQVRHGFSRGVWSVLDQRVKDLQDSKNAVWILMNNGSLFGKEVTLDDKLDLR